MCRYGSIEPDPDNPQQSYLDYVESFPLNAEPEVSAPYCTSVLRPVSSIGVVIFSPSLSYGLKSYPIVSYPKTIDCNTNSINTLNVVSSFNLVVVYTRTIMFFIAVILV